MVTPAAVSTATWLQKKLTSRGLTAYNQICSTFSKNSETEAQYTEACNELQWCLVLLVTTAVKLKNGRMLDLSALDFHDSALKPLGPKDIRWLVAEAKKMITKVDQLKRSPL